MMKTLTASVALVGFSLVAGASAQTTEIPQTTLSLYIAQECASMSRGGRCSVYFVQMPAGQLPTQSVEQRCAPGWLAHVSAERGTVERGGVNRGQAVVCGHEQPESAIRALLVACDAQTFGICSDANYVNVTWAYWSGEGDDLQQLPMGQALPIGQLPDALQCESVVPLAESAACPPQAAVMLRNNGLR